MGVEERGDVRECCGDVVEHINDDVEEDVADAAVVIDVGRVAVDNTGIFMEIGNWLGIMGIG